MAPSLIPSRTNESKAKFRFGEPFPFQQPSPTGPPTTWIVVLGIAFVASGRPDRHSPRALGCDASLPQSAPARWLLSSLWLRPPRHAGPLPRMRCDSAGGERSGDMKRAGHLRLPSFAPFDMAQGLRQCRRWFFNFAAAVSMALCLLTAVLWVRGYTHPENIGAATGVGVASPSSYVLQSVCVSPHDGSFYWNRTEVIHDFVGANPGIIFFSPPDAITALRNGLIDVRQPQSTRFFWRPAPAPIIPWTPTRWGFGYRAYSNRNPGMTVSARTVATPAWLVFILSAATPLLWYRKRQTLQRAMWRLTHCLCSNCGYDLRATPDRCPECGAIPPAAKGAAA